LVSFGYQPQDIRRVIATHGHWDHLSAMSLLRQESDATLFIHQADGAQVETGDGDLTAAFLYNRPFWRL
jgi:glyoxylase-like metal-dependent hydrolase (beta-lactamase superfamily II)